MSLFANYRADRLIAEVKSAGNPDSPLAQKALEKLLALGPSAIDPIVEALTTSEKRETVAYVEVLSRHYGNRLGPRPTIRQFYLHIARLGGHQNRKCDGDPGWLVIWRGWMKLQAMLDGYHAAQRKTCGKT